MDPRASELISLLHLREHPEGGYYREVHRADERVRTERGERSGLTIIYYLLPAGQRSSLHQVSSEEVWYHIEGAPLQLHLVAPDLTRQDSITLDIISAGGQPLGVVPRSWWQAAESTGPYTLVSCVVAPGFEFEDFRLLRDLQDEAAALGARFPDLSPFI